MITTTRRGFLQSTTLAGIGALGANQLMSRTEAANTHTDGKLTGMLVAVGFGAKRSSTQPANGTSVITELDLSTGGARSGFIPLASAHTLMLSPFGPGLCLPLDGSEAIWVDSSFAVAGTLVAPGGYLFSGHGVLHTGTHYAFISLRRRNAQSFSDTGRIGIVDLRSKKLIDLFNSGGVRPHDLDLVGKSLVVSHYGDIKYERTGITAMNAREPRLVTLDIETGRVLQVIDAPPNGSLTHLAVGGDGKVCAVPLNYQGFDDAGRREVERLLGDKFEISVAEELEGRIAVPMPILVFDRKTGSYKELRGEPGRQRRAQSVAFHPGSKRFFITYSFSDTLACADETGVRYVSGFDLGLSFVRGVCAVGNTGLIAVTGEFRGVALVDATSLTVVKRFDVSWFDHPHVTFVT